MTQATDRPPLGPRHWPTWIGIGAMAALARLPWPLQRGLGRAFGAFLRMAMPARRRIAARNLELCFPERDAAAREALLREHFASLGIGLFEFARAWWGSVDPMRKGLGAGGRWLASFVDSKGGGAGTVSR